MQDQLFDTDDLLGIRNNFADKDHWMQGDASNEDGTKYCAVGHIAHWCGWNGLWEDADAQYDRAKYIAIENFVRDVAYGMYSRGLASVNDGIGHEAALNVFDEAIRISKEQ